jgi:hypothetical protein
MGYMKRMARSNGQIVIASIHQPRSAIWSMFDTVRARWARCGGAPLALTSARAARSAAPLDGLPKTSSPSQRGN